MGVTAGSRNGCGLGLWGGGCVDGSAAVLAVGMSKGRDGSNSGCRDGGYGSGGSNASALAAAAHSNVAVAAVATQVGR